MKYLLIVSMDITSPKEELFNDVYDTEHIPAILKVPGVVQVWRHKLEPMKMNFGSEILEVDQSTEPKYTAVYEIEGPHVLETAAWGEAVQFGRWPNEVRPHTSNRQFALRKLID